ncbi:type VI secretion system contractile sheath domain-containing protein [Epibacterium ulvae]|uniref:type VI secretion system contractile sheath domain-containing protein n=1 Tax=Epibacterium ulvae TaxID=1156985 RepID=UPI00333EF15A
MGDVLSELAAAVPDAPEPTDAAVATLAALADAAPEEISEVDIDLGDLLGELDPAPTEEDGAGVAEILAGLECADVVEGSTRDEAGDALNTFAPATEIEESSAAELDDILGDLVSEGEEDSSDELADILGDLSSDVDETPPNDDVTEMLAALAEDEPAAVEDALGLDDLLGDLTDTETEGAEAGEGLDDILADLGLDDEPEGTSEPAADASDDLGLDDLLGDLGLDDDAGDTGLDDLLSDIESSDEGDGEADLDALLADAPENVDDDLAGLLDALDLDAATEGASETTVAPARDAIEFPFGTMSATRPAAEQLKRRRFRIAVLGDFSGRSAKSVLGIGDDLANRPAQLLDVDTVEEVIEGFAGDLALPIGKDGAILNVPLGGLDDLHPDELYEKLDLFSELAGLKQQLSSGATADHAAKSLKAWGEKYGTPAAAPRLTSSATTVPADLRLSDFQRLIGDTTPQAVESSPVEELLQRVVGPHIRALPDPNATAMAGAVTQSLTHAMRMVLHHPEFQAVEAQWRTLDLMARSIQTDDTLELMLYDVSAEELAADLAAEEDLTQSGFLRLLTDEPMDPELGRGGYSAIVGLYTFEETPPHAELLGRLARVAAHVDAPFLTAIAPTFLASAKEERPKLVAEAWDTLTGMAEASHLGLVSPRFLLRRPYGAKTDPIYEFDFEEFSQSEGLKGMLWGNPVALAAVLMARSFKENGPGLNLGSIMSLGEMPYHYVLDRFGDQVALPCTERNIDLDKIAAAKERGFMAVSAVKGRDEVRLTSFMAVSGGVLAGPWSDIPPPPPSPPKVTATPEPAPDTTAPASEAPADAEDPADLDAELDALLAGFDDTTPDADVTSEGEDDFDAELAALLDDL